MGELVGVIRPADVIDVLLVATLVYPAVVWVRRTQAGLVAAGLFILAGLYAVAQLFELRLLTWLLHGFFAIILIVVVVIFQEEFRQLFERLALWSLRRGTLPVVAVGAPEEKLVQCLTDLARERIGALVVLPGTQPIDRHLHGGIDLGGALSVPLLRSIFDPHSPGHDGAVVVQHDRITRFAVHLPLSTDATQLAGVGTRHGAALGLAERTDALCLVVSEERGEVSTARDGRLRRALDPAALAATLGDFVRARTPARGARAYWSSLLVEHGLEKVLTLSLVAALWWALVPGSRLVERTFEVPVRVVDLPAGIVLDAVEPASVALTVSGRSRDFYLVRPGNFSIRVDAALAGKGRRTFRLDDATILHPAGVEVVRYEPEAVRLSVTNPDGAPGDG